MHRCLSHRFGMGMLRLLLAIACLGTAWQSPTEANEEKSSAALQSTTSRAAKQEATQAIPLERMAPKQRRAVQQVLDDCSLYRRLPTGVVACQPDMFTFLMQHPEVLVDIWRELGISQVDLRRMNEHNFHLTDNAGTTAGLTIVEQQCEPGAQNRIVMYADGAYDGKPFKRPVRAQCVLLLRSGSFQETNDATYVAARLDTFIRIDRTSIKLFAKALHPLVGKTADANFLDTLTFVSNLSRAAEQNPGSVERMVRRLPRTSSQLQHEMLSIASRDAVASPAKRAKTARAGRSVK